MKVTLDTNVLIYALDHTESGKQAIAEQIIERSLHINMILTTQVLGEYINAVKRRNLAELETALKFVELWSVIFPVVPTHPEHVAAGCRMAIRYRLQFWDSVILAVAKSESVGVLLSEDMQDGATIDGVTILNPFNPANRPALDSLLAG